MVRPGTNDIVVDNAVDSFEEHSIMIAEIHKNLYTVRLVIQIVYNVSSFCVNCARLVYNSYC